MTWMGPFIFHKMGGAGNDETPVGEGARRDPTGVKRRPASSPQESVQMWNRPDRHDQHKPSIKRNVVFHSVDERLMSRVSGR